MIALPGYVDPEAWAGFVEMRKKLRKPMTPRAEKMLLSELDKLRRAGHCPNACLDQSTLHCWLDVYAPKQKAIPVSEPARSLDVLAEMDSARAASQTPEAAAVRKRAEELAARMRLQ